MLRQVNTAFANLSQRVRLAITKALVDAVDDTTALQLLKIRALDSEVLEAVENIQQYGFSSVPPKDSELLVAEIGGSRDHLVAIASDNSAGRPTGSESGEVSVWSEHGQRIYHKADGSTVIEAAEGLVRIQAKSGAIEINNGNITVEGNLTVTGSTTLQSTLTCVGAATFSSVITAVGNIISAALVQGLTVAALATGLVTLSAHTHAAPNTPPTPGT